MPENEEILSINFNQDCECFACGCRDGFRIFNSSPLKQIQREYLDGSIAIAEMLFRCNYLALVGGGKKPAFPTTKVVIWDYSLRKSVIELNLDQPIIGVRLRRDRIAVVLDDRIRVFTFSDIPVQLFELISGGNPRGICALSTSVENPLVAFPSHFAIGQIDIVDLSNKQASNCRISAHNHEIFALTFNIYGTLLATASIKGTIVRLFDASKGVALREFRRGSNQAKISCIKFSLDSKLVAVSSDHSTIHVFEVNKSNKKRLERYIKGDVSFSRMKASTSDKNSKDPAKGICQCGFDRNSESIIALGSDGSYFNFQFDGKTGATNQQNYCLFMELNNDR
ncbi:WD repeat domain phosphoinositide-interacting protein 3 [Ditylenchus destructor]|uniref:WD repeat domain phosphoinositide-interacting protein 3 n=1 Tax=Ditylenchus destructor TaxID=166010 RepID=A0AAD4R5E2_9BILA|nr:WD repeat domain phosphoinositide-interacting protein 3 [Ditylenchus destructor]